MASITFTEEFYAQRCAQCMVHFAYPEAMRQERGKNGGSVYCPNGHVLTWRETAADQLRRERDRLAQQIAQKDDEIKWQNDRRVAAEKTSSALRGTVTKLQKRAANGVCPCCTRSFQNLRRHMATKHPDFSDNVIPMKTVAG